MPAITCAEADDHALASRAAHAASQCIGVARSFAGYDDRYAIQCLDEAMASLDAARARVIALRDARRRAAPRRLINAVVGLAFTALPLAALIQWAG